MKFFVFFSFYFRLYKSLIFIVREGTHIEYRYPILKKRGDFEREIEFKPQRWGKDWLTDSVSIHSSFASPVKGSSDPWGSD
ncbi:hypothetical protein ES319_A05G408100v1 [Gossypium barbadense]|uniref:Uncharacterized protein n=1 Tax=Gossypium barbadense TaxID=3634 RepID=A0A5J5W0Z3_GOSBA|nr:hypothetical protein ES319_A05G408100v1 [Gossypium barbadense]